MTKCIVSQFVSGMNSTGCIAIMRHTSDRVSKQNIGDLEHEEIYRLYFCGRRRLLR